MARTAQQVQQAPTSTPTTRVTQHEQRWNGPEQTGIGETLVEVVGIASWPYCSQSGLKIVDPAQVLQSARGSPLRQATEQIAEKRYRFQSHALRSSWRRYAGRAPELEQPRQRTIRITLSKQNDGFVSRRRNRAHLPQDGNALDHRILVAIARQHTSVQVISGRYAFDRDLELRPAARASKVFKKRARKPVHRHTRPRKRWNSLPVSVPNSQFAMMPTLRIRRGSTSGYTSRKAR